MLPFGKEIALASLLSIFTIIFNLGLMATSAFLIASCAFHPPLYTLMIPITGVRFFGIGRGILRYGERVLGHNVSLRIVADLRSWLFVRIEPLAPAKLYHGQSGDYMARVINDVSTLQNLFIQVVVPALTIFAVPLFTGLFIYFFHSLLSFIYIAFLWILTGIGLWTIYTFARKAGQSFVRQEAKLRHVLLEYLSGLRDIVALNSETFFLTRIFQSEARYYRALKRLHLFEISATALLGLAGHLFVLVVLLILIPDTASGRFNPILLPVLLLTVLASFEAVQPLVQTGLYMGKVSRASKNIFHLLRQNPEVTFPSNLNNYIDSQSNHAKSKPAINEMSIDTENKNLAIEMKNIEFSYPNQQQTILRDFQFTVAQGQKIVILGPSGLGKSTILHLLLRFWKPNQGKIFLYGKDIENFSQAQLYTYFSAVSQFHHIFHRTLFENMQIAAPNLPEKQLRAQINEILYHLGLQKMLSNLPEGLDSLVSEAGTNFSGGEWRRLALAQAILKDGPLFLLDEPTESLDTRTEKQVIEYLKIVLASKTGVIVSHREQVLELADRTYLLQNQNFK